MNRLFLPLVLGALFVAPLAGAPPEPPAITALAPAGSVRLFNGHNLDGWTFYQQPPVPGSFDLSHFWSVHDDILSFKGGATGYLRTKISYSSYNLHVEYRWPEKVGASGVLVHVRQPDAILPYCVQITAILGATGDLVPQGGFDFGGSSATIKKSGAANEQLAGDWNSFDIFCRDDFIAVYSNGELKSQGAKPSATSGQIALQLDGTAIEFRNVWLEKF